MRLAIVNVPWLTTAVLGGAVSGSVCGLNATVTEVLVAMTVLSGGNCAAGCVAAVVLPEAPLVVPRPAPLLPDPLLPVRPVLVVLVVLVLVVAMLGLVLVVVVVVGPLEPLVAGIGLGGVSAPPAVAGSTLGRGPVGTEEVGSGTPDCVLVVVVLVVVVPVVVVLLGCVAVSAGWPSTIVLPLWSLTVAVPFDTAPTGFSNGAHDGPVPTAASRVAAASAASPLAGTDHTPPLRVNAICCPSGDHAGSAPPAVVIWRGAPPARLIASMLLTVFTVLV